MRQLPEVIADNIKRLRKERKWSQADLAARMFWTVRQWTPGTVGLVETGKQRADRLMDLAALCDAFGVPLSELIRDDESLLPGDNYVDTKGNGDNDDGIALADIRAWLDGKRPVMPEPIRDDMRDPYEMGRLAKQAGLSQADLEMVCTDLYGRADLDVMRNEMAGSDDDRRTIQAKRGHVTRQLLAEVAAHVESEGVDTIRARVEAGAR